MMADLYDRICYGMRILFKLSNGAIDLTMYVGASLIYPSFTLSDYDLHELNKVGATQHASDSRKATGAWRSKAMVYLGIPTLLWWPILPAA
jgi:hypothetical protein